MKLKVNDVPTFLNLLSSVVKIVPDAKFTVNSDGVEVKVINESQTVRAYFKSDCISSVDDIEFCFKDIINLRNSIALIQNIEQEYECEIDFNGTFLSYKNDVTFKLKAVKSDIIERYITTDISTELKKVYEFETTPEDIKKVLQCTNIVSDSDSKIYFIKNEDKIIGEIDDKNNKMANSIGLPISDEVSGDVSKTVSTTLDNFRAFATLPSDEIHVTYTDKGVFEIRSEYEGDDSSISLYLISTTLKS